MTDEHARNQIFFMSYPKNFCFQSLQFGPIRWFPRRFLKISIIYSQNLHFNLVFLSFFWKLQHAYAEHTQKRFYRMLSLLGTNFIAHWEYKEPISAHAQPAVKCEQFLHVQYMLIICETNFIVHWAYAERISWHAEHTRNWFHRMLSIRGNV